MIVRRAKNSRSRIYSRRIISARSTAVVRPHFALLAAVVVVVRRL